MMAHVRAEPADRLLRGLRALVLAGVLALVLLGLAWELWLAPTGRGTLALKVLPLLLTLVGLLRDRLHSYRALSLLVWLYVLEGLMRGTSERGLSALLAGLEVALALIVFTAATLHIRRRLAAATAA